MAAKSLAGSPKLHGSVGAEPGNRAEQVRLEAENETGQVGARHQPEPALSRRHVLRSQRRTRGRSTGRRQSLQTRRCRPAIGWKRARPSTHAGQRSASARPVHRTDRAAAEAPDRALVVFPVRPTYSIAGGTPGERPSVPGCRVRQIWRENAQRPDPGCVQTRSAREKMSPVRRRLSSRSRRAASHGPPPLPAGGRTGPMSPDRIVRPRARPRTASPHRAAVLAPVGSARGRSCWTRPGRAPISGARAPAGRRHPAPDLRIVKLASSIRSRPLRIAATAARSTALQMPERDAADRSASSGPQPWRIHRRRLAQGQTPGQSIDEVAQIVARCAMPAARCR